MFIRNLLIVFILGLGNSAFAGSIVCKCTKIWSGGSSAFYYGQSVAAGTVVAKTMEDAQFDCDMSRPSARYNGSLSNCETTR